MNYFSDIIGWIGVVFGALVTVPQVIKSSAMKSTKGVSLRSYQFLLCMVACYLVRALEIKDPVFIVSNAMTLIVTVKMLYLFKLYPEGSNEKS